MAAKEPDKTPRKAANGKATAKGTAVEATGARTVAKPRAATPRKPAPITPEMIAERAYYIAEAGSGMSDLENWLRAESELLSGARA